MNSKKLKATGFRLGHRFSKHRITRYANNFGRAWPLCPPGYAYAWKS